MTIVGVIILAIGGAWVSAWLRPNKPYAEKLTTYESGVEPVDNAWAPVNSRLYIIGLVFILFELETILLFPWATVWLSEETHQMIGDRAWNLYMAILGTFFILVLGIGLIYAVVKGRLAYFHTAANVVQPSFSSKVPLSYYEKINEQYASHVPTKHNKPD
ncbi:NADH-quinone oxidoreductase subunit A [Candidatus Amoebophilus asiaticus]|uniref:NADH-quinone oxidoreductase subunit A n=1 Tax=Candidatus Amoebophilus asiaticus TaxID=281120 RepID=UPI00164F0357|nr:NADH-quinone oxidoreductase subunit A [Candidatus Amoebophilus asiaticus]